MAEVVENLENDASQDAETSTGDEANEEVVVNDEPTEELEVVAESAPARDADGFSSALPSLSSDAEPRKHVPGGVGYEVIFVVRTGDAQLVENASQKVRELIENGEGAVDNVRASEVRRFAYPIKKQTEGVYIVVNARFKPDFTNELERFFKIDESILRHMVLKDEN